jgi:hypothetical protein
MIDPVTSAMIQAQIAVSIVSTSPESSISRYVPVPFGAGSRKMCQFQL